MQAQKKIYVSHKYASIEDTVHKKQGNVKKIREDEDKVRMLIEQETIKKIEKGKRDYNNRVMYEKMTLNGRNDGLK